MVSQGQRTHTCGALRASDVGARVALSGWVNSCREMGSALVFVDLRDKYGITQVAFDDSVSGALRERAQALRPESVIHVAGKVRRRPPGQANKDRATGEVEVLAEELEVLSAAATPPFDLAAADAAAVSDELRLQYRYLDLRRPRLQRNLKLRHDLIPAVLTQLSARGFTEVETPVLPTATPEGARDYLVPSRVHRGQWYALPQSPQIFKQILMVAGLDKYFQICRCFRDEDLRADRQPEFSQIDIELSFPTQDLVLEVAEAVVRGIWKDVLGVELAAFPRMTWDEAMARFGVDAPDLRFGMELVDVAPALEGSTFGPVATALAAGGICRAFVVKGGG